MVSSTEYSVLSTRYSVQFLSISLSLLLSLTGCDGSAGPTCHPVQGKVLYQNQPLAEAMVVFHPLFASADKFPQPIAHTDAEGRFILTTLKSGDGAPEGEYAITVEFRDSRQIGEEMVRDGRNLLPPRYGNPSDSQLQYKVVPGPNTVPDIKLTAS
jgi:hypothetical protein